MGTNYMAFNQTYVNNIETNYKGDGDDSSLSKSERFERTVLIHLEILYKVAMKYTSNSFDAENLVQDTILKAYKYFHYYEPGTNCKAWLMKIMHNTFINDCNKKKRRPITQNYEVIDFSEFTYSNLEESDVENEIFSKLLDEEINEALDSMPPRYRIPVILADVQDFSYKEIADIMNVPIGTVKSAINRGRKMLRNKLINYGIRNGYIKMEKNECVTVGA